jgi:anti-anti-sigma regulatory factor
MALEASSFQTTDDVVPLSQKPLTKARSAAIIITIAGVSFLNTLGTGLLTVALVQIKKDLNLPSELLLWSVGNYMARSGH